LDRIDRFDYTPAWSSGEIGGQMKSQKNYTVSDGKLVLTLQPADEGGYVVT
jgi:hypothetical protein